MDPRPALEIAPLNTGASCPYCSSDELTTNNGITHPLNHQGFRTKTLLCSPDSFVKSA